MTRWRAVRSGVLVALGVNLVMCLCFVTGIVFDIAVLFLAYAFGPWTPLAGLAGGVVAGYRSASGLTSGCWHGLLAGVIGGLSIVIVSVVLQLVIGLEVGLSAVISLTGILLVFAGVSSVIAGGIGASVQRRRTSAA